MKQTIDFKKTCIMKTYVEEITDISVSHDYKIGEDTVEGYFDIVGKYKVTRSSVNDEDFMFTVPFTIALGDNIDKDSINLTMKDFEYSIEKDLLHLDMKLNMEYSELAKEIEDKEEIVELQEKLEIEPEKSEEITKIDEEENDNITLEDIINEEIENMNIEKPEEVKPLENENQEEKLETKKEVNNLLSGLNQENSYYKYKIYIMKQEDTLESIAIKYDTTLETLKEYNNLENLNVGDKIIIPKGDEE